MVSGSIPGIHETAPFVSFGVNFLPIRSKHGKLPGSRQGKSIYFQIGEKQAELKMFNRQVEEFEEVFNSCYAKE
jgi:hypothetical protein